MPLPIVAAVGLYAVGGGAAMGGMVALTGAELMAVSVAAGGGAVLSGAAGYMHHRATTAEARVETLTIENQGLVTQVRDLTGQVRNQGDRLAFIERFLQESHNLQFGVAVACASPSPEFVVDDAIPAPQGLGETSSEGGPWQFQVSDNTSRTSACLAR